MRNKTVNTIGAITGGFIAIVLWTLLMGTSVFAGGGPHEGTFTATTDACSGCHRTHSASAAKLLDNGNQYALCTSCHGGSGADTDVVHGVYLSNTQGELNHGLKGGGFQTALMNTELSTSFDPAGTPVNVTSTHTLGVSAANAWGSGTASGNGEVVGLECGDCHNPHGNANYRILREQPKALAGWEALPEVVINTGQTDNYTVGYYAPGSTTGGVYTPYNLASSPDSHYSATPLWRNFLPEKTSGVNTVNPNTGNWYTDTVSMNMSNWCGQCHTRYDRTSRTTPNAEPFLYGHKTDFSLANNGSPSTSSSRTRNCLMCHVAHGSSASMSGVAAGVEWPGGAASVAWQASTEGQTSRLLAADNRGVCRQCHVTLSSN